MYISLRPDELEKQPLRPGLSAVISIDVHNVDQSPNADMRAQKIVSENLVEAPNAAIAACPVGE